jgi:hypothetical protein
MSDFTDFFPVSGGSGVGSGIPINGYFPFIVSSTGDPTGYNSTTGLYTHPDGTFWLKSGFRINSLSTLYPSATGVIGYGYDNFTFATTYETNGVAFDGTDYFIVSDQTNTVRQYTSAGVFITSFSVNSQASNPKYATFDGTNLWVTGNVRAYAYTTAGVYTGTSINLTASPLNWANLQGMAYDGTNLVFISTNNNEIATFTTAGVYVSNSSITTPSSANGMTYDGTNFWVVRSSLRTVDEMTPAGVLTGNSFNISIEIPSQTPMGIEYNSTISQLVVGSSGGDAVFAYKYGKVVGDPTARTDTDSAQPLFVRIG